MLRKRQNLSLTLLLAFVLMASQLLLAAHGSQHGDGIAAHTDCVWCTADIASDLPPPASNPLVRLAPVAQPLLWAAPQAQRPTPRFKPIRAPPAHS